MSPPPRPPSPLCLPAPHPLCSLKTLVSNSQISTPSPGSHGQDGQQGTFSVPVDSPHNNLNQLQPHVCSLAQCSPELRNLTLHHSMSVFSLANNSPSGFFISCLFFGVIENPQSLPPWAFLSSLTPPVPTIIPLPASFLLCLLHLPCRCKTRP